MLHTTLKPGSPTRCVVPRINKRASTSGAARARDGLPPLRRLEQILSMAFWPGVALALVGLAYLIGGALDSLLLGFLGADFVFLLAAAAYSSGQGSTRRNRR